MDDLGGRPAPGLGGRTAGDISYPNGAATERPATDPYLAIGADKLDAGPAFPSFRGLVDEVRLSTTIRYCGRRSCGRRARSRPTRRPPRSTTSTAPPAPARPMLADAAGQGERAVRRRGARAGARARPCRRSASTRCPRRRRRHRPARRRSTRSARLRLIDTRPTPLAGGRRAGGAGDRGGRHPGDRHDRGAEPDGRRTRRASASSRPGRAVRPSRPTSNLNFAAGQTVANFAAVNVGAGGRICVTSPVTTHVIVDATGWWGPGGLGFGAVLPTRLLDTRPARCGLGHVVEVQVTGRAGIPANAQAAALNLTATSTAGAGLVHGVAVRPGRSRARATSTSSAASPSPTWRPSRSGRAASSASPRRPPRRSSSTSPAGGARRARLRATRRGLGPPARHPPGGAGRRRRGRRAPCRPASPSPR